MSKTYSNKALPAGTVLREWRLEEVLGVGGFGIVYKGRGIYFNELVAIKEYFPSSISERDAEDTVVPIDSDAEEVHALGLKKFVEEAKLLWNLSTPSRHPNIVNVRSLFEIHGTAYMVMDFEDGVSLSRLLKQGGRFNERSLIDLVRPIAEGLERAHRVGVLHRDIKPPNILINEDGRPVLIDFGSARFETGDATSTTVTFHTPPYAAIEQYVKTYQQGPWTDVYALGVVLAECVTGKKPAEVLERMHGGAEPLLAEGKWPGYGKRFLQAIDAAMTIRPSDRPQSIADWLAMFDGAKHPSNTIAVEVDDEATRFVAYDTAANNIVPIAPPPAGFVPRETPDTGVPADPAEAHFKRAGKEKRGADKAPPAISAALAASPSVTTDKPATPLVSSASEDVSFSPSSDKAKALDRRAESLDGLAPKSKKPIPKRAAALLGGVAAVLLAVGTIAFWPQSDEAAASGAPLVIDDIPADSTTATFAEARTFVSGIEALSAEARGVSVPQGTIEKLDAEAATLAQRIAALQDRAADPAQASALEQETMTVRRQAASALATFANLLMRDVEAKHRELSLAQRTGSLNEQQLATLRATAAGITSQSDATSTLASTRSLLAAWQQLNATLARPQEAAPVARNLPATPIATVAPKTVARSSPTARASSSAQPAAEPSAPTNVASRSKIAEIGSIVSDGRKMASRVIRMGDQDRAKPGADVRSANAKLARNYDSYLNSVRRSSTGALSEIDADRVIKQASQTREYLRFLEKQSAGSLGR